MTEQTPASTPYERVTYRTEDGRARTIYLHRPAVSGPFLTGIEVNREGDEIADRGYDERRHLIATSLVVKRLPMVMDRVYGELVAQGEESDPTSEPSPEEGQDDD